MYASALATYQTVSADFPCHFEAPSNWFSQSQAQTCVLMSFLAVAHSS